jgi:hypothetical protein
VDRYRRGHSSGSLAESILAIKKLPKREPLLKLKELLLVPIGVEIDKGSPLFRNIFIWKDRLNRASRYARTTNQYIRRIYVKLGFCGERFFIFRG